MSERKPGWYWVREFENTPWKCQQWNGEWWHGRGMYHEPAKVGPCIPTPDEPWQCVPVELNMDMAWAITQGDKDAGQLWDDTLSEAPKPEDT